MRKLITADSHIAYPLSLLDELPAYCRAQLPHLQQRADGRYLVTPAAANTASMTGARGPASEQRIDDDRELRRIHHANVAPGADPGYLPEERLQDMAREGVEAAVLIGPVTRPRLDPDTELGYCRLINDWQADVYKHHYDRFAPGIVAPLARCKTVVQEMERAASLGLRPLVLPDAHPEGPYYLPKWEPLWEAANALEMPIAIHASPNRGAASQQPPWPGMMEAAFYLSSVSMGEIACWFALSGVLARYPKLHLVLAEGYSGWFAFLIDFLDHQVGCNDVSRGGGRFSAWMGLERAGASLEQPPSHYLKRQVSTTFTWDPTAIQLRDRTGLACLMWGNDYPHVEGAFPHAQSWVDAQFAGVPEEEVDQIVRGNAARLFRLTV